jgi:hypothetical protein
MPTRRARYHIVPGSTLFSAAQLTDGKLLTTSLPGAAPLRVSKRGNGVVIMASGSEARLTAPADVRLCHGALHGVDTVLLSSDRGADVAMLG